MLHGMQRKQVQFIFVALFFILTIWILTNGQWKIFSGGRSKDGIKSNHLGLTCEFNGYPICCAALGDAKDADLMKSVRNNLISNVSMHHNHHSHCEFERKYISSPYETRHMERANTIGQLEGENDRRKQYLDYLFSAAEIDAAKRWLERVKVHSLTDQPPEITADDFEFMSRFEITRKCRHISPSGVHSNFTMSWLEWIEPLSMHARHPFAIGQCKDLKPYGFDADAVFSANKLPTVNKQQIDYILLQSSASQYNNTMKQVSQRSRKPVKHYLLDAGTSMFNTSLYWFVCAYLQRGMSFDQLFGWEKTKQNIDAFWAKVPPRFKAIYQFFNVPIQAVSSHTDSPLHVITTEATRDDFVSFKLDIDTPHVEIPIAMQILKDPQLASLIDEFFFELHFRCEWMMYCGWHDKMPEENHGLKLDRPHAMEFFLKLRNLGIRSHIWP